MKFPFNAFAKARTSLKQQATLKQTVLQSPSLSTEVANGCAECISTATTPSATNQPRLAFHHSLIRPMSSQTSVLPPPRLESKTEVLIASLKLRSQSV